jgi:hypothetical protein
MRCANRFSGHGEIGHVVRLEVGIGGFVRVRAEQPDLEAHRLQVYHNDTISCYTTF